MEREAGSHRKPDVVIDFLLGGASVGKVLDPEVEDLRLGQHVLGLAVAPLPELGDEGDVADGRLEVPGRGLQLEHALRGLDGLAPVLGQDGDLEEGGHVPVVLQRR